MEKLIIKTVDMVYLIGRKTILTGVLAALVGLIVGVVEQIDALVVLNLLVGVPGILALAINQYHLDLIDFVDMMEGKDNDDA
jgi:hypothetical protein